MAAANVHEVSIDATVPDVSIGSAGQTDSSTASSGARPKLILYRTSAVGGQGQLSRRIEQIVLFTKVPSKFNNANSYTKPDFRAGIASKFFDIETIDVKKGDTHHPVKYSQAPAVILLDSEGNTVAKLNGSKAASGKLYAYMVSILRKEGKDVSKLVPKAARVLTKLYVLEIDIQKLEKRNPSRSINERLAILSRIKSKGIAQYRKVMTGS